MFFDKNGKGEYFDSYGLPPHVFDLQNFMDLNSRQWIYTNKTLQRLLSTVCGHYCVYYLLFRCRNVTLREIVSRFSSNLSENDYNVHRVVNDLWNTHFFLCFYCNKQRLQNTFCATLWHLQQHSRRLVRVSAICQQLFFALSKAWTKKQVVYDHQEKVYTLHRFVQSEAHSCWWGSIVVVVVLVRF